ncbi:MAG: GNAT family N-acetyltransferase [Flavobacteriales bacterium]|nr:GNAT family N-acetyltransferase [Flavobacteriales bacterium]
MEMFLFESNRLGFRKWSADDIDQFAALNANEEVMKHFPSTLSREQTTDFIDRLQKHQEEHGYCYFAVQVLETSEFIGFIGLAYQKYESEFSPNTDIGWRLKNSAWGNGYATEGAKRVLDYAFTELELDFVFSTCTEHNIPSENVMKKIGMKFKKVILHPNLKDHPDYERCKVYTLTRSEFLEKG